MSKVGQVDVWLSDTQRDIRPVSATFTNLWYEAEPRIGLTIVLNDRRQGELFRSLAAGFMASHLPVRDGIPEIPVLTGQALADKTLATVTPKNAL